MNNSIKFLIDNNSIGERLDVYLARKLVLIPDHI